MLKPTTAAQEVLTFFTTNLQNLSLEKKAHFAERMYRITGNQTYVKHIKEHFINKKPLILDLIDAQSQPNNRSDYGRKLIAQHRDSLIPRIQARIPIYEENTEFIYYRDLLYYLNKLNDYQGYELIGQKNFSDALESLRKQDLMEFFYKDELMKVDPVQTINALYHARNLNLFDAVDEITEFVNALYENTETSMEFENKLYYLTHILLSESQYYQKFIAYADHSWIFDYFESNTARILESQNDDLIAEIGVCYKLAKKMSPLLRKIKDGIAERITQNQPSILLRNDIPFSKEKLGKFEHRNILAIMLLSEFDRLYPGPTIHFKE